MSMTKGNGPLLWAAVGLLAGGIAGWWVLQELVGPGIGMIGALVTGGVVAGLAFASSSANGGKPPSWLWPSRGE